MLIQDYNTAGAPPYPDDVRVLLKYLKQTVWTETEARSILFGLRSDTAIGESMPKNGYLPFGYKIRRNPAATRTLTGLYIELEYIMNNQQAARLTYSDHYFGVWMPYTFEKLEHPTQKHCYLPLNRYYKPLGISSRDHVDYEAFRETHGVIFPSDPTKFDGIWEGPNLYLYYDRPESRVTYFERLSRLMTKLISLVKNDAR